MIALATRRRHLNNNNGTTTPLAAARGSLDPPNNNNYKDKKHYRRNMNSSNLTLLRIYSVVCTLLLICSLTYQLKILHDGSHRSMLQTSNLGVRGGMVGIGKSISDSDTDDSSDAHKSLRRVIASTHQVISGGSGKSCRHINVLFFLKV